MVAFNVSYKITEKGKGGLNNTDLAFDFAGTATLNDLLAFTKRSLIVISDQVLKEEQSRGFPREDFITRVDGNNKKPIELVKPLGKIEFIRKADVQQIALDCFDLISQRSPIDTGLYVSQNLVFFNGEQIASTRPELVAWFAKGVQIKPRDRIRFVNATPYAQKLERYAITAGKRGVKRTRPTKDKKNRSGPRVLKPNGVYALSYRALRAKYKANAFLKFSLLPGQYLGITEPLPATAKQKYRSTYDPQGKYNSGFYIYPTILIGIQEGGVNL